MEPDDPRMSKSLTDIAQDDTRPEVRLVVRDTGQTAEEKTHQQKVDDFMRMVNKWWKTANDAEALQRRRSLEEQRFDSGDHWDEGDRRVREDEDRVVIEINRTPQFLKQVGNEMRMTRPQIIVKATGDGADPKTAEQKNGIIRSIQKRSGAENIRDEAFYGVLQKGFAHWRVNVDWESDRSNKQVIRTGRIFNDFSVYTDPAAVEPDRSDANYRFIIDDIARDVYDLENMDSKIASMANFVGIGDAMRDWVSDKIVRVAELWYRDRKKMKLYTLADKLDADGKFEDELERDKDGEFIGVAKDYLGMPVWRWSWRTKIMWAKVNAVEVIDGNEDKTGGREYIKDAKYIPIITALGRKILVEGKYIYTGMVRDAMAPCLASDYWLSALTEMVALGPKAPWIVAWEAVKQHQDMWDQSNLMNYAALYYDHRDANGDPVPPPFRQFGEAPIQSMTFILKFADEDLKRVMGIYNAGLGAPGPESSGLAINSRKAESDVANFDYIDNFKVPMEYEAKIYLDLIPKVYSAPQMIDVLRENGTSDKIAINQKTKTKNGDEVQYMMGDGYDAEIEIGPSYSTKREAAVAQMTEFVKTDPTIAPLVDDLIADQMDFPNRQQFVKRLKSRVPPELQNEDEDGGNDKIPPQFKAQYDAQAKKLEEVTQVAEEMHKKIETDELKYNHEREMKSIEIASMERIAKANADKDLYIRQFEAKHEAGMASLQAALDQIRADIESSKNAVTAAAEKPAETQMTGA